MTDNAQSIPSAAANLQDQSDALLKRCGFKPNNAPGGCVRWWEDKDGNLIHFTNPYANAQDAINLAEAMGFHVRTVDGRPGRYGCLLSKGTNGYGPTIAAAICAAIEAAVPKSGWVKVMWFD